MAARAELVAAAQRAIAEGIAAEALTEQKFASYLTTDGIPDPDLLIPHQWRAAAIEFSCSGRPPMRN